MGLTLLRRIFSELKLKIKIEDHRFFFLISCEEFPFQILQLMPNKLVNHNKHLINFRQCSSPLTPRKLRNMRSQLENLVKMRRKLMGSKMNNFMRDLLTWTSIPNDQRAMNKLISYKSILWKYAIHKRPVYRGIVLNLDEYRELMSGKPHRYDRISSWAGNLKAAIRYAKNYSMSACYAKGRAVGVVFEAQDLPVLFNVPLFVKENMRLARYAESGAFGFELEPASLYESEIIVGPCKVDKSNIVYKIRL